MSGRAYAGGARARYLFLGATCFLLLFGAVMVYSASSVADFVSHGDSAHHFKRQLMWIAVGFVAMFVGMKFDYRRLRSLAWTFYAICLAGLGLVLVMGVGKWGATRWIDVGGFTIQPSEYAKLACVLVTALLIGEFQSRRISEKVFWGRLALSTGAVAVLVMAQPDMGTTMSILIAVFVVLVIGGIAATRLWTIATAGLAGVAGLIAIEGYRAERFLAFVNPWHDPQGSGYQAIQAMLAFGSGGLTGVGLGLSRQKYFYLPAAHTDFIFAIIGEELGLVGTLAIVAAFALFAYAGIKIALGSKDRFGRLVAGGLTAMIVIQAGMNMAAVTSLMPVTGITMPLVSFGGSSLTFTMLCIGIVLSVSTNGNKGVRILPGPASDEESVRARDDERRGNRRPRLSGIDGGRGASRRRA